MLSFARRIDRWKSTATVQFCPVWLILKTFDLHICTKIYYVTFLCINQPTRRSMQPSAVGHSFRCSLWSIIGQMALAVCHVYTIPFQRSVLCFMTNRFRGRDFDQVTVLVQSLMANRLNTTFFSGSLNPVHFLHIWQIANSFATE